KGALRLRKMMDREPRDDAVELRAAKWRPLGVPPPERDVRETGLGTSRPRLFKHLVCGVEGHDRLCLWRQCCRDDARPTGDVEQVPSCRVPDGGGKSSRNIPVGLLRPGVERVGLSPKFLRHALEMIHR